MTSGHSTLCVSDPAPINLPTVLIQSLLGKSGSRMHVLSVEDLPYKEAFQALSTARLKSGKSPVTQDELNETLGLVGGRLSYITKVLPSLGLLSSY